MVVRTSPFSPVRLSGRDAAVFARQLRYGRPKKAARAAAQRAERIREEFAQNGFVVIRIGRA